MAIRSIWKQRHEREESGEFAAAELFDRARQRLHGTSLAGEVAGLLPAALPLRYREFVSHGAGRRSDAYLQLYSAAEAVTVNRPDGWKRDSGLGDGEFCFAGDIFGNQFYFGAAGEVARWTLHHGERETLYDDFDEFLLNALVHPALDDDPFYELFETAVRRLGAPPPGAVLACLRPPVLGGAELDPENYRYTPAGPYLAFVAQLVRKAAALPPGSRIRRVLRNPESGELEIEVG